MKRERGRIKKKLKQEHRHFLEFIQFGKGDVDDTNYGEMILKRLFQNATKWKFQFIAQRNSFRNRSGHYGDGFGSTDFVEVSYTDYVDDCRNADSSRAGLIDLLANHLVKMEENR